MSRWRIVVVMLFSLLASACQTELYRGLSQRDVNEMAAVLANNGINATREAVDANTFRLTVPEDQFHQAVEVLRRTGYPREAYQSLGDVFKGDGLIVSPYEQRVRMMFAQNQEMTRTISAIDGVVNARVHVVVPELDLRGQPMTKPTASVVVQHRPNIDTGELSTKIRLLVANGVQGLDYRDVSIGFFVASDGRPTAQVDPFMMDLRGPMGMDGSTMAPMQQATPTPAVQPSNSFISLLRYIVAIIMWVLAVIMALAGLAFLAIHGLARYRDNPRG